MVLFRNPSDRKQIDMIAERIFAKDKSNFMSAYAKETRKALWVSADRQSAQDSGRETSASKRV